MAAMMLMLSLSHLFPPRLFKAAPAWMFLCGFHFFLYLIRSQNHSMADFKVFFFFTHISSFLCRYNDDYGRQTYKCISLHDLIQYLIL